MNKYTKLESCCSVTQRFSKIKGTPLFCIYLPLNSHQYVAFHLNKFNSPFHKDALMCHWVLLKFWRSWKCQNFIEKFIETQFRHHAWAWGEFGSCTLKTNLKKTMYVLKCCNLILQSFNLDWNYLSAKDESPKPLIV